MENINWTIAIIMGIAGFFCGATVIFLSGILYLAKNIRGFGAGMAKLTGGLPGVPGKPASPEQEAVLRALLKSKVPRNVVMPGGKNE